MFDGIVMNTIDMTYEIRVISDRVFPISSLPKCKLAIREALDRHASFEQLATETALYATPASREIAVVRRQRKYGMQVLGQHDNRIDREGAFLSCHAKCRPQSGDVVNQGRRSSVSECKREEKSPAWE